MALEIRRTPTLQGEDARRFLKEIETQETKLSHEEIRALMEQTAQMRKKAKFSK